MPSQRSTSLSGRENYLQQTDVDLQQSPARRHKRLASVYDAVAGRVGFNGFLSSTQIGAGTIALTPEEVLLRRVSAPASITREYYNADERLEHSQRLPDSDLLRAFHSYASTFYSANVPSKVNHNYRSLDETGLMAFAILLEEAVTEELGENGDMVLVEPEGLEDDLPETAMTKQQVRGKVKPPPAPDSVSSKDTISGDEQLSENDRKIKRQRRRYDD